MSIDEIRESGILEMYVIGAATENECDWVEQAMADHPELKQELYEIELSLESYAKMYAVQPPDALGPMVLAMANYTKRIQNGEEPSDPPALHLGSQISDYGHWLNRQDLQEPDEYDSMHGYIIGATEEKSTLIVWLKDGAPDETHTSELETFLIVEGTCNITIGSDVHSLKAGDVLSIPLHISHRVEVTSDIPCKIILERKVA